jgi:Flp pilus assembly protein TadG
MTRRLRQFVRDKSGANLIEAAIVTPLLLLLTFAICDFSTLFFVYLALENGVTTATRVGVTGNLPGSREDALMAAMRDATPTLTIPNNDFTFSHLSPGASGWVAGAGGPDDIEKMTVTYTWKLMTPVLSQVFPGGEVQIKVESSRKNEWKFQ